MNAISKWTMALALLSVTAYGQVPTTNDTSDENANTGMGTESLGGPAAFSQGFDNTAVGDAALRFITTGNFNTATGAAALANNTTSNDNTATGYSALIFNKIAADNTAVGFEALFTNDKPATGVANQNTASGSDALESNTTGSNNIAVGFQAGLNVTTGSDNIDIGNEGEATDGVAASSGVIRIGTAGTQATTFIAGIEDSKVTGKEVFVTTSGQLGVKASAERYKTAIEPMDAKTDKLNQLRPVTFHLKAEPQGEVQYGLIAEEVAKIYPELVTHDREGPDRRCAL